MMGRIQDSEVRGQGLPGQGAKALRNPVSRSLPPQSSRTGTIYIAVMGVTLIVGVVALASTTVARLELRGAVARGDMRAARLLAQSGVEYGQNWIHNNSGWRTALTNGQESTPIDYGSGTFTWSVTDADGNLGDSATDSVTVRGVGRVGNVRAVEEVTLQAGGDGISSLEAAMHCDGLWDANGNTISSDGQVSANGAIDVVGSSQINGNAWATGEVWNPANVSGTITDFQPTDRVMPSSSVFDYYLANGTWMTIDDLGGSSGNRKIELELLSPALNPFGDTNPMGIYVIDCGGQDLDIRWCRIVGTIVLLNTNSNCRIDGEVCWDPAVPNYPALLVDGPMRFDMKGMFGSTNLTEAAPFNPNYNPEHTPFQGEWDTVRDDTYTSEIRGLVYVSGTARITDDSFFAGSFVCGALIVDDHATFNYSDTFFNNPPPGFATGTVMEILPGSWKRAAY